MSNLNNLLAEAKKLNTMDTKDTNLKMNHWSMLLGLITMNELSSLVYYDLCTQNP